MLNLFPYLSRILKISNVILLKFSNEKLFIELYAKATGLNAISVFLE